MDKMKERVQRAKEMKSDYEQLFKLLLDDLSDISHGRKDNLEDVMKKGYMSLGFIGKEYSDFSEE